VKKRKRMLSLLVTLAMVIGLMPGMSLTAYAKSKVKYLDASGAEQSITNYFEVESDTKNLRQGWYVVNSDVEINETFSISEDVNLILCDGAKLTVTSPRDGISAIRGSLTIYAQSTSDNMGKLEVTSTGAGIRLNKNLTINGGKIETQGSYGIFSQEADITINGGNVTADGCIFFSTQNNLTITGGKVIASATGTDSGIYTEGEVIISGGNVSVTGDENPAIGGTVKNSIAGTGWTNKAGTEGKADIAISTGQTLSYKKVQFPAAASHTHNFTYSSDGAVITATCSASGCTLTDNKATLTIVKPTLTTYGETGKSADATLTGLDTFNTATSKTIATTDIKYVGRGGTTYAESATAPTNAGKYTAKITLSGVKTSAGDNQSVTASVDYEIARAATSVTTPPTASEITYGQTLAVSTLTGGTASVAGTFAWKDTTIAPAVSDSENTEYDVVFTPTDGNYSTAECKVKLTVNKANPTNTVGQLSTFVGQTLANVALPTADNGAWSWVEDTTTTLENVGMATYHAKFTPNDTANYNTLENVEVEIQVAEKPSAVAATVTANNRTYDGSEKPLVNVDNSTLVGGEMQYALGTATEATGSYTTSIPTATEVGTYYVWYRVDADDNHNDWGPYPVTVAILSAKVEPGTPTGNELVYNGQEQPLVKAGSVEGNFGTLLYAVGTDNKTAPARDEFKETLPARKDAGTYYVWYMVQGDKNHNDTEPVALEAKIAQKSLVVSAEDKTKTYGDPDPELTWTQEGLVAGDSLNVTLKREAGENVGGHIITVDKLEVSDNYTKGFNEAVMTINAREATVIAVDQTITEGETIKTDVSMATLSGGAKGDRLVAVTLTASVANAFETFGTITASGAKIVNAQGVDVTGNYSLSYAEGKLTVNPNPIPEPDFTTLARMTVCGSSKKALKIEWTKVEDADGYDVYFGQCGKDFKKVATVKGSRKYTLTKLKKRVEYKASVQAWKWVKGRKTYIGESPEVHAITGGYTAKSCNIKSVTLNKSKLNLEKGKSSTLKARLKGVRSGKKLVQHVRKVRWYSSNTNVATVNKDGKVKAVGRGECTIYAIANNGVRDSVKVTVK